MKNGLNKMVTVKALRVNHFYARRNESGQLEMVQNKDVVFGEKYYELAAVAGGSE